MITENREHVNNAAAVDGGVNNETLADIVAEMRRGTKLPGFWRSCDLNKILKYHADRLEAALKREKDEIEADALAAGGIVEAERHKPGNAAAMREALDEIRVAAMSDYEPDADYLIEKCNTALTAPARNCDRFATVKDAAIAFARERQDAPQPCPDFTFSAWLLAPAAERKGGAK